MDTDSAEAGAGQTDSGSDKTASKQTVRPRKKRTAKSYALSFFVKLFATALILTLVFRFIAGIHICHTNSAYPTIRDGEFCLMYQPKQGTMIVYRRDGEVKFGRVIAFSGDKVSVFNDFVSVNDYGISDNAVYPTSPEGSAISYPYQVPENCVFVLNDFRSEIQEGQQVVVYTRVWDNTAKEYKYYIVDYE
ncbi:MAG: signal peptidase I [Oscillospiraceae bacterium]|nr:signal peptidase I [Oscillospiraceae bacterium]